jgi:hypothetical protein
MAKNKTVATESSVADYLWAIADEKKRKDTISLLDLIETHTGLPPKMWGTSIIGFGSYHYKYESGREGDMPLAGLAARANAITLYIGSNFKDREALLSQLGKHKTGKGCLYIAKLEDIDTAVLIKMIAHSIEGREKGHDVE